MTIEEYSKLWDGCGLPRGTFATGLSVGPLKGGRVGFHFYSAIPLRDAERLYGPWLRNRLRNHGFQGVEVRDPGRQGGKKVKEGYAAEVILLDGERHQPMSRDDSDEKAVRILFENLGKFLEGNFPESFDPKSTLREYFNEHGDEVEQYALARSGSTTGDAPTDTTFAAEGVRQDAGGGGEPPADAEEGGDEPRNLIFFGAPGTGKSHRADTIVKTVADTIRTTFHPDSDYASFVGCYKPTMKSGRIAYEFVPQAFTKAYVQAWRKMAEREDPARQYLVIEEINRGNCAQVFGDVFQLLDRAENGFSKFPIEPDADLAAHLKIFLSGLRDSDMDLSIIQALADAGAKGSWDDICNGAKLVLPPNLYIWATMNTSDQSLFPMDSAFKRRWDWRYSKIRDERQGYKILADGKEYPWWDFLRKINAAVLDVTKSADKQLGYFFVKLPDGETKINADTFVGKAIFYLWNDVFRDCELEDGAFMADGGKRQLAFDDFYDEGGEVNETAVGDFLSRLLSE